ncbi:MULTISPECIES: antibiotic biosynthesis monooxygenase [unclassified Exiguobacterium]|uniref:antibiotic biosynthesis monooxygenase n=1 Tax=unclassified Exiguobacterium TaxID=2644629 RepID=UPI001BE8A979|nr:MULTISPECIES: antibiotic biosynthesis monooxygenase [unclassified Exiguobacterium]
MWIVMNKLDVEKGKVDAVKARFETTKGIEAMDGFVRMQVLTDTSDAAMDHVVIMTTWRDAESFENWRDSNAYKHAHKKRDDGTSEVKPIVLGNTVTQYEVAIEHLASTERVQ